MPAALSGCPSGGDGTIFGISVIHLADDRPNQACTPLIVLDPIDNLHFMIQLHRLEGFYWVARSGGYARAARAFPYPITQPAVHQQVKKLESELDAKLFERQGRDTLHLTPAGRSLYDFVAPFFERLPAVLHDIRAAAFGGTLRVHAEPLFIRRLLPAWLQRLQLAAPDLSVDLRELVEPDPSLLLHGQTDLIVANLPQVPADVESLRIATLRAFLVVPTSIKTRSHSALMATLNDKTFISYSPETRAYELQQRALRHHELKPERSIAASSTESISGFVEAGLGYSLVPSLDPEGPRAAGLRYMPLDLEGAEFPVFALWRRGAPANPLLDAALEVAPKP